MKVDPVLLMIILGVVALEPGVWPVSGRDLSPARLERFRQEARAIQGLRQPGLRQGK